MSSHLLNEVQEVCTDVTLINKGKMLRTGSVEDLINEASVKRMEVRVTQPVGGELLNKISRIDGVSELRAAGTNQFVLSINGGDEVQAKLLTDIQALGMKVVSFKESGLALESLYMSLIKESR
jgi:ABC-2 type transport system ATP-binding protein